MPHLTTDDGVKLYYEEAGDGAPIVFVHEFAGDCRSWEHQLRYFGRRYRCIAYNARGFPPSDVPDSVERYSQERARDDIKAVLDALKLDKAHIVGLSMGGFAALHFGFTYPERTRSLVVGGCGYGAAPDKKAQFAEETEAAAKRFEETGMGKAAIGYATAPSRVQFQNKDPRGWKEFADQLAGNSTKGSALTMRGVQKRRPSLFDLVDQMKTITAPTLVMTGDEDWPCLEPAHPDEENNSHRRASGAAKHRPHDQPGGTGRIQSARSRLPARGRAGTMAGARSAGDGHRDPGQVAHARTEQKIYSAAFKAG